MVEDYLACALVGDYDSLVIVLRAFGVAGTYIVLALEHSGRRQVVNQCLVDFFTIYLSIAVGVNHQFLVVRHVGDWLVLFYSVGILYLVALVVEERSRALDSYVEVFCLESLLGSFVRKHHDSVGLGTFHQTQFAGCVLFALEVERCLGSVESGELLVVDRSFSVFLSHFLLQVVDGRNTWCELGEAELHLVVTVGSATCRFLVTSEADEGVFTFL